MRRLWLRFRELLILSASARDDADTFCPVCSRIVPAGQGVVVGADRCCSHDHADQWWCETY